MLRKIYSLVVEHRTGSGWRLPALDGLRGIAATMVLVAHVRSSFAGKNESLWWAPIERGGHGGVVLFFVLSGFLLYLPWLRAAIEGRPGPRLKNYFIRRCLRIMPAYYGSVIALTVLRVVVGGRDPISVESIALHFLFLPTLMTPVLTVYWTLQVEEFFYWVLPVLHRVLAAIGSIPFFILTCVISFGWAVAGVTFLPETSLGLWLEQTPFFLPVFSLGILIARSWQAGSAADHARLLVVGGGAFYFAFSPVALHVALETNYQWTPVMDLVTAPALSAVVLGTALGGARFLEHPFLRFLGGISFSLYLWHMVVIRIVPVPGVIAGAFVPRLMYQGLISIAVALVSYLCVERPFLKLRPTEPTVTRTVAS